MAHFFPQRGGPYPPDPFRGRCKHPPLTAAPPPPLRENVGKLTTGAMQASHPHLRSSPAPTGKQRSIVSLLFELLHSKFAGVDHTRAICFGVYVIVVFALAQFALFGFNKFARESMIERFPVVEYQ